MAQFVNIHGQPVNVELLKREPRPPRVSNAPAKYHKGWRVDGRPPGSMEAARDKRNAEIKQWADASDSQRAAWRAQGTKEPKPFDEAAWKTATRLKAVRSKPYEIEASAHQCARMATAAGWTEVQVTEIKKV